MELIASQIGTTDSEGRTRTGAGDTGAVGNIWSALLREHTSLEEGWDLHVNKDGVSKCARHHLRMFLLEGKFSCHKYPQTWIISGLILLNLSSGFRLSTSKTVALKRAQCY